MTYLLIALVMAIIVSPMLWLRQTPRQKLVSAMRQTAAREGFHIRLVNPPDAREGEGHLEYVSYTLPWRGKTPQTPLPRMEKWLLVSDTRRGDPSPWINWQWLGREANPVLDVPIGDVVRNLPAAVKGLEASAAGLSIYWQERGKESDVAVMAEQLLLLMSAIRAGSKGSQKEEIEEFP